MILWIRGYQWIRGHHLCSSRRNIYEKSSSSPQRTKIWDCEWPQGWPPGWPPGWPSPSRPYRRCKNYLNSPIEGVLREWGDEASASCFACCAARDTCKACLLLRLAWRPRLPLMIPDEDACLACENLPDYDTLLSFALYLNAIDIEIKLSPHPPPAPPDLFCGRTFVGWLLGWLEAKGWLFLVCGFVIFFVVILVCFRAL